VPESSVITSVYLAAEDGSALPPALAGQYLTLRVPEAGDPPPIRSYSLSSAPGSDVYRISVKREGLVSSYVHTKLQVGASVQAAAPRGEFVLVPGAEPVLLISAGVGITPVLAMLHKLAAERSEREVWWLHTARDAEQQAFAQEAHQLLSALPSAHELVFHTALADSAADEASGTSPLPVRYGRLSADVLAGFDLPRNASAYICGPERFMADMTTALVGLGLDQGSVHTELFGARAPINPGVTDVARVPPHPPEGEPPGNGPLVTFARSGLSVPWNADTAPSLLEFAEACDVPTRWACRAGVCHTCVTALIAGEVAYRPEPLELPASGQLLVCCARPTSDLVLDL
jgi:ferredoxin-NADP reductase